MDPRATARDMDLPQSIAAPSIQGAKFIGGGAVGLLPDGSLVLRFVGYR